MSEGMGTERPGGPLRLAWSKRRAIRRDDEASAGVVSILLAILVFVILLTLVTSVWMPEWMETAENDHSKEVNAQFAHIKSSIDKQILNGDTKFLIGNPLTLGSKGVSIFGTDSSGTFSINSFTEDDLSAYCNVRNESGEINVTSTGGMRYESNNIHYVDQFLAYENGAIILGQGKGQVVRTRPQFTIEKHGPVAHMGFTLITVSGLETSITGTGTIIVQTKLVTYTTAQFRHDTPQWVNITMISEFPAAWARFYNNTLIEEGFSSPADYTTTVSGNTITVSIRNVMNFDMGYALVNMEIEEAVGGSSSQSGLQNVVGLWHMNDDAGATAMDSSQYHNDANLIDGPTWIVGPNTPALNFDGIDDHGHAPYIPAYDCPDGITVMALVRWTIDPATGDPYATVVSAGEHQFILMSSGLSPPGPGINEFFEFAVETDQGRNWSWSNTQPVANVWYHVTGVYSPAEEAIRLYVNGTLENTTWHNGTLNVVGQGLTFGNRWHSGAHDRWFQGDVDEVIIFDRALSDSEIQRHYQSLKP
jgi:hypothetical protein